MEVQCAERCSCATFKVHGCAFTNLVCPKEETMTTRKRNGGAPPVEQVAGNGLLHRRALLGRGIVLAGAAATGVGTSATSAAAEPLKEDPWSLTMGSASLPRQVPSRFEGH